jgi:hypothetical protein
MTESAGPPTPLRPYELLRALLDNGVEFIVIGGFSLAVHGYVRATKDIDIVPEPSRKNLARLMTALESLGAQPTPLVDFEPEEMPVQLDVDGLSNGGNWILNTDRGRLDVMQWASGMRPYPQLREAAVGEEIEQAGGRVWFAGIDDLIAMKQAAGRPQDLIDIAELERARGGME